MGKIKNKSARFKLKEKGILITQGIALEIATGKARILNSPRKEMNC
jgi:hypothetical protein